MKDHAEHRDIDPAEQELSRLRLLLAVNRVVFEDVRDYLDDDESIDLVIADVLHRWQERDPDATPNTLDGPDGFWNQYADRVEHPPPPSTGEFRPEFCPDRPGPFDVEGYYRAVWRDHVTGLAAAGVAL
ncbi:hypothetical protein [Rugosimonospora africana]|uniref:Uncharacterized protein n=1 Tax=Rugosimonospora africana TaxID=556532 RepID=A0A8J3QUP0_9ACTN|nr:hypothetical protein [Rugosimonospora africana]GIH16073.1 hypothetical protein Raf01_42450 [Rugosimonospora africana]